MNRCTNCKEGLIPKEDKEGTPLNYWTDLKDKIYCDDCFHKLYYDPWEKAMDKTDHSSRRVRLAARKKLDKLEQRWDKSSPRAIY